MQIKLCSRFNFMRVIYFHFVEKGIRKKDYKLKMGNKKQINFMEIVLAKTIQKFR